MTTLHGAKVQLRPLSDDDVNQLWAIRTSPEVSRWWGDPRYDRDVGDVEDSTVLTVVANHEIIGAIQWSAEEDPAFRHANIDIYLDSRVHGQGLGPDAIRTLAKHLITDHGFHRITIDPSVDNTAAIYAYAKVGFERVGKLRQYWRDANGIWQDGLLMELIGTELR